MFFSLSKRTVPITVALMAGLVTIAIGGFFVSRVFASGAVSVTSSDSGSYKAGGMITLHFDFGALATSTDSLTVHLNSGGTCTIPQIMAASQTAVCTYTVGATDNSNGDLSVTSIAMDNGGSISFDPSGDPVDLGIASNLAPGIIVDTTLPAFTGVVSSGAHIKTFTDAEGIGYSLSENLASGQFLATRTGGSADPDSPHTCTLAGTALTAGAHSLNLSDTTNGCTVAQSLVDGATYDFEFSGTDAAGNDAVVVTHNNVTYDATAPVIDSITSDATAVGILRIDDTVHFVLTPHTAEPNATVSGSYNGELLTWNTSDAGATYTATYTVISGQSDQSAGGLQISGVTVTDQAGNVSSPAFGSGIAKAIDANAPAAPSTPNLDPSSDSGTSSTDDITNDDTPTFAGTAESGAMVTLYDTDGSTVLGTGTATGGNWTITSSSLSDGSHTITAKATDTADNTGVASSGLSVTIDTSAPATPVVSSIATDDIINAAETSSITVAGTAEANSTVSVALGDGSATTTPVTATATGGSYSVTIDGSSLAETTITPVVTATDAAGNTSSAALTPTAYKDVTAPIISANGFNPDSTQLALSTYTDAGATATDSHDGSRTSSIVTVNSVPDAPNNHAGTPYTITYDVTDAAGNAAIQKVRTVNLQKILQTINFSALGDMTYGDSPFTVSATANSGLIVTFSAGGTVGACSVSGTTVTITGVGTCTITANQSGDTDYNAASPIARSFTINQKTLTVTATGVNKAYDGTNTATVNYGDNRVGGDTLTISGTATFGNANVGTSKAINVSSISLSGTDAGKYVLASNSASASANITAVPLSITANDQTKTYDASAYGGGNGLDYSGFVNSETASVLGGSVSYGGTSQGAVNYGTYVITPSGLTSGNYNITFHDGMLTVNKAPLTITAQPNTKVYDGTNTISTTTPSVSGLQGSDTVTGLAEAYAGINVGSGQSINVSGGYTINDGNSGSNYLVNTVDDTNGVITAAPVTVTGITASDKTYDGTTSATINTASASLSGVVSADVGNVSLTGTPVGTFADKNVGTGKTVTINGYSLTGSAASNYSLTNPTTTADITVASGSTQIQTTTNLTSGTNTVAISSTDTSTSTISIPSNVSNPTLDLSLVTSGNAATVPAALAITSNTGSGSATVSIPQGTVITSSDTWDGTFTLPTVTSSYTLTPTGGYTASAFLAIEVGSADHALTTDHAIRIVLPGQVTRSVGWSRGSTFTPITTACSADTQAAGDALGAGGDCYITSGSDIVVWTKHLTAFVSYVQSATTAVSGGGSGGGGAPVGLISSGSTSATTPASTPAATQTTGRVLGASAYSFAKNLSRGSNGNDVMELQKILIAQGFMSVAANGNFGPATEAAVKAYQKAHGLEAVGAVGPQTRALLNQGATPTVSDEQRAVLIAQLQAKLQDLLKQIAALTAAKQQ